jgi:hypothetical protein
MSNNSIIIKNIKHYNNLSLKSQILHLYYIIQFQRQYRKFSVIRKNYPAKIINYYYNKYLDKLGVKKGSANNNLFCALEYLYINLKKEVHIDEIRTYVQKKGKPLIGGTDTLQVRHLGQQYGYNILKGGDICQDTTGKIKKSYYMLVNLKLSYPNFCKDKRKEKLNNNSWSDIKNEYDNKCVHCGSKEGEPLRWNNNKITVLAQGHQDPRKELSEDNIIPQCSICNQQYKNKAIFNRRGFIIDYNKLGF